MCLSYSSLIGQNKVNRVFKSIGACLRADVHASSVFMTAELKQVEHNLNVTECIFVLFVYLLG